MLFVVSFSHNSLVVTVTRRISWKTGREGDMVSVWWRFSRWLFVGMLKINSLRGRERDRKLNERRNECCSCSLMSFKLIE
jgi:hypothetical protein